jgi:spore coat protein A
MEISNFMEVTMYKNKFYKSSILLVLILSVVFAFNSQPVIAQPSLLDAETHLKFVNNLPIPARIDAQKGSKNYVMNMQQTTQWLGLYDEFDVPLPPTTVWGYGLQDKAVTYPGPTFVTKENVKVRVRWQNKLPGHFLPVDASLHMAHPMGLEDIGDIRTWYAAGNVPAVTHLHGGHTESASDGLPEAWFTQGFLETGRYFVKEQYLYDNTQEAATLWYHDHALGITRLNVYAGLAGFYLLRDNNELKMIRKNILPGGPYEIEIVIQDRMFDTDGELFYPAYPGDPAYDDFIETPLPTDSFPGGGPTALAEFFGDFIIVNGIAWPKLEVEPRKYRFRLLNGSDSRFYILKFEDGYGMSFQQIGTEDGFLPEPVSLDELLIGPGERADLIVDFSSNGGKSIVLQNIGPDEPYGGGIPDEDFDSADPLTTGQIMRFDVNQQLSGVPEATVDLGTSLRKNPIEELVQNGATRSLVLFEGLDEYGRLQPLLGTLADGSLTWNDAITENPMKNDIEVWEVYNATGDAHPVHQHLVAFQIINRESFTSDFDTKPQLQHNGTYGEGGIISNIVLGDDARLPEPNERGWKDTAIMLPGEVTRVIAKYDLEGRYVWHCHILSHEDHEMMRPFHVGTIPTAASVAVAGELDNDINLENPAVPSVFELSQNYPNPFNPTTEIRFSLPEANHVSLKVYNSIGQEVATLINADAPAGYHTVKLDASEMASGIYIYKIEAGSFVQTKKMILMK